MISFLRTDSENIDFRMLVALLDKELAVRDGSDHTFYAQFNKIDSIKNVVVAYNNQQPIGCGAFKPYNQEAVEIKRMYVAKDERGKGLAGHILTELENWGKELGYQKFVLETGTRQPEAIALYKRMGYIITPNYGQYIGVENSVCFAKE